MSERQMSDKADEQVDDLEVGKEEAEDVMGGKAGKGPKFGQEYLVVKLEDVKVDGVQPGQTPP